MEFSDYLRFILALVFVIGLIGLLAVLAKRFGFSPRVTRSARKDGRLSIVDVTNIDGKRKLLLIRRDDTEHLVLLGATTEVVIETGITPPADTRSEGPVDPPRGAKVDLPRAIAAIDSGAKRRDSS